MAIERQFLGWKNLSPLTLKFSLCHYLIFCEAVVFVFFVCLLACFDTGFAKTWGLKTLQFYYFCSFAFQNFGNNFTKLTSEVGPPRRPSSFLAFSGVWGCTYSMACAYSSKGRLNPSHITSLFFSASLSSLSSVCANDCKTFRQVLKLQP